MGNIGLGFCKGFGGLFGVVAAILLIALVVWLVMYIHDCMIIRKEMPKMLLMARKFVVKLKHLKRDNYGRKRYWIIIT